MKDYYKIKKVSNSSLSWFQKSPKYFKLKLDGELEDEFEPPYYKKGRCIHEYLLEANEFDKNYLFLDYIAPKSKQQKDFCKSFANTKKGSKDEKLIRAYKKVYAAPKTDDKILTKAKSIQKDYQNYIKYLKIKHKYVGVLPKSEMEILNKIRTNALNHKKAKELLYNEKHEAFGNTKDLFIQNELQIEWVYPNGLECKCMLDRVIIDHKNKKIILVDLKTTSPSYEFKEGFEKFKYYRQMAFYWMSLHWYFKNKLNIIIDDYEKETYMIDIIKDNLSEIKVFKVTDKRLIEGLSEIENLMIELSWHFENDKWDYNKSYYIKDGYELI